MINIDWIADLINQIPELLNYIVQGYIFLCVFEFLVFKNKKDDKENTTNFILLKSIVISYAIKVLYDKMLLVFSLELDRLLYTIILYVLSAVLAYSLARIIKTKWFNSFLGLIGINRTVNDDIWSDAIRDGCYLRVFDKDGEKSYSGTCKYREVNVREPIVVLTEYQILDTDGKVIIDNSKDLNRNIVLNLKDFKRVDITQSNKLVSKSKK